MTEKFKTPRKRRRRTCYDRLRARWLESLRRQRAAPAVSAAAQMMTLFAFVFGRMPLVPALSAPAPYVPPPLSPGHARRIDLARRLGIPSRYLDAVLAQGNMPYSVLFEHLRRGGRSREDAMIMLRQRAPDSCRDWLDHVENWGLWSSLLLCHVRNGADEDTDLKLLRSTLAWLHDPNSSEGARGPADAGTAMKPDFEDDDPNKPKGLGF